MRKVDSPDPLADAEHPLPDFLGEIKGDSYFYALSFVRSSEYARLVEQMGEAHLATIVLAVCKTFSKLPQAKAKNFQAGNAFLARIRGMVARSFQYGVVAEPLQVDQVHLDLGTFTLSFPENLQSVEGLNEKNELMTLLLLLEDYLMVLRLCVKLRQKNLPRNDRKVLEEECMESLTNFDQIKESAFQAVCESWGFSVKVSGRTLFRKRSKLAKRSDLKRMRQTVERNIRQLHQVIKTRWKELA